MLQGSDFTTPDGQITGLDYTTSGNDRDFASGSAVSRFLPESSSPDFINTVFPFMAVAQEAPADNSGDSDSGCSLAPSGNAKGTATALLIPALMFVFTLGRRLRRK